MYHYLRMFPKSSDNTCICERNNKFLHRVQSNKSIHTISVADCPLTSPIMPRSFNLSIVEAWNSGLEVASAVVGNTTSCVDPLWGVLFHDFTPSRSTPIDIIAICWPPLWPHLIVYPMRSNIQISLQYNLLMLNTFCVRYVGDSTVLDLPKLKFTCHCDNKWRNVCERKAYKIRTFAGGWKKAFVWIY